MTTCRDCNRILVPDRRWALLPLDRRPLSTHAPLGGRGLCATCWARDRRNGTQQSPELKRPPRDADEVLDAWVLLSGQGLSRRDAAEKLGMTKDALEKAISRAARRGDPRAFGRAPERCVDCGRILVPKARWSELTPQQRKNRYATHARSDGRETCHGCTQEARRWGDGDDLAYTGQQVPGAVQIAGGWWVRVGLVLRPAGRVA